MALEYFVRKIRLRQRRVIALNRISAGHRFRADEHCFRLEETQVLRLSSQRAGRA